MMSAGWFLLGLLACYGAWRAFYRRSSAIVIGIRIGILVMAFVIFLEMLGGMITTWIQAN